MGGIGISDDWGELQWKQSPARDEISLELDVLWISVCTFKPNHVPHYLHNMTNFPMYSQTKKRDGNAHKPPGCSLGSTELLLSKLQTDEYPMYCSRNYVLGLAVRVRHVHTAWSARVTNYNRPIMLASNYRGVCWDKVALPGDWPVLSSLEMEVVGVKGALRRSHFCSRFTFGCFSCIYLFFLRHI